MVPPGFRGIRRAQLLLTALIAAAVTVPLLVGTRPGPVEARCYGKYAAKCQKYVGACHGRCGKTNGVIRACASRELKAGLNACRTTARQGRGDCAGNRTCKGDVTLAARACFKAVRATFQADIRSITGRGYGAPACNRCCNRTDGQGDCLGYFDSSRFYGSYKYHGLQCVKGSPSGAFVQGLTGCVRSYLASLIPSLTSHWSDP